MTLQAPHALRQNTRNRYFPSSVLRRSYNISLDRRAIHNQRNAISLALALDWLWPAFNQIFLVVYLSSWLRRSKVMTGAEWWRFNGYAYFWGMVAGISSALLMPKIVDNIPFAQSFRSRHPLNTNLSIIFPLVLVLSLISCFIGTLLTRPEDDAVLMDFYRRVRPWGFWGPVLKKVLAEYPGFKPSSSPDSTA